MNWMQMLLKYGVSPSKQVFENVGYNLADEAVSNLPESDNRQKQAQLGVLQNAQLASLLIDAYNEGKNKIPSGDIFAKTGKGLGSAISKNIAAEILLADAMNPKSVADLEQTLEGPSRIAQLPRLMGRVVTPGVRKAVEESKKRQIPSKEFGPANLSVLQRALLANYGSDKMNMIRYSGLPADYLIR